MMTYPSASGGTALAVPKKKLPWIGSLYVRLSGCAGAVVSLTGTPVFDPRITPSR